MRSSYPVPTAAASEASAAAWPEHFEAMYEALSIVGHCDSPGGAENRRVREEAIAAGHPQGAELAAFIHRAANWFPGAEPDTGEDRDDEEDFIYVCDVIERLIQNVPLDEELPMPCLMTSAPARMAANIVMPYRRTGWEERSEQAFKEWVDALSPKALRRVIKWARWHPE